MLQRYNNIVSGINALSPQLLSTFVKKENKRRRQKKNIIHI